MSQYAEYDKMFGTDKIDEGYNALKKKVGGGEKNPEILWRLAQFCYERALRLPSKSRKDLTVEGRDYALEGHKMDEKNYQALKWAARKSEPALSSKLSSTWRSKVNPKDRTTLHLRGRYTYAVANLSWMERKVASAMYSTVPKASFEDALADFIAAYTLLPDWIENDLFLGKCYLALKDKANAKRFFTEATKLKPLNDHESDLIAEANQLLSKC
ncbi:unnamed protein product [Caenorhabditis auriculariae]|uniref:Regulator of microtubule dynamics protein 1 n=1 Tax=Caenorhabditis auriculariae TaxID=2777116 RepID=A0A8S1HSS4_9PELO|nr:unnamed protein product [Caenorhabditis auriculariae]